MYFGFGSLGTFPFVATGFVIVMIGGIALALVYVVGATRGKRAAWLYTNVVSYATAAALGADVVWAILSGQWAPFIANIGWWPLAEMVVLAAMFLLSMWWMAVRYVSDLDD